MKNKTLLILTFLLLFCGCQKQDRSKFYLISNNGDTLIQGFDSNLKPAKAKVYKNQVLSIPSSDTKINNKYYYDIQYSSNYNSIYRLNLNNLRKEIIKTNNNETPQLFDIDKDTIIYTSNFVGNNSLNKIYKNKESSIIYKDYFFNHLKIYNNSIYAFAYNKKDKKDYLLIIDYDSLKIKAEITLVNHVLINSSPLFFNNKIYYVDEKRNLKICSLSSHKTDSIKLSIPLSNKLRIFKNNLYISNSDSLNMLDTNKKIVMINLKNNKLSTINLKENVYDFTFDNQYVYYLSDKALIKANPINFKPITTYTTKNNFIPYKIIKAKE